MTEHDKNEQAAKPSDAKTGDKGGSTVDPSPGKQGYQNQSPSFDPKEHPVPEWKPGENPPGTNPPKPAAKDPATTPIPGTDPVFNQDEPSEHKAGSGQGDKSGDKDHHAQHQSSPPPRK